MTLGESIQSKRPFRQKSGLVTYFPMSLDPEGPYPLMFKCVYHDSNIVQERILKFYVKEILADDWELLP